MYEVYTVKGQDTLDKIADKYGTTVGVIRQINGFASNDEVMAGDQIVVPVMNKQPYQYYTVKKGDNLYEIAKENDIDYSLLLQLNGLDEGDYIYPNQTLMLPKKGIDIYLTKNDDTISHVLKKFGISIDDLLKENENIYLRPEQILIFRKK